MTFPQVLVGERSIGGFRELIEADRDGILRTCWPPSDGAAAAAGSARTT